jgi:hypothetical protein
MTSQPWWHDPGADGPGPERAGSSGQDLFGPAVQEAARLASALRDQATSPAVQETVAGGLTFVAAFLRGMASPTEPVADDLPPNPLVVVAEDDAPGVADAPRAAAEPAGRDVPTGASEPSPGHDEVHVGSECRSCPVCQGLALLREVDPALVDGLGDALDTLASAARTWLRPPGA